MVTKTKTTKPKLASQTAAAEVEAGMKTKAMTVGTLLPIAVDRCLSLIVPLKQPWTKLSEKDQERLKNQVTERVRLILLDAIDVLLEVEWPMLEANLIDFTVKGGDIRLKLETYKNPENLLALGRIGEGAVKLLFDNPALIDDGSVETKIQPDPDAPKMPLEPAPADDRDLADGEAAEDEGEDEEDEADARASELA